MSMAQEHDDKCQANFRKAGAMKIFAPLVLLATLSGCISFGPEAPPSLLTLTPAASMAAGSAGEGNLSNAMAVQVPSAPQRLSVTRVPLRGSP